MLPTNIRVKLLLFVFEVRSPLQAPPIFEFCAWYFSIPVLISDDHFCLAEQITGIACNPQFYQDVTKCISVDKSLFAFVMAGVINSNRRLPEQKGTPLPDAPNVLLISLDTARFDHFKANGKTDILTPNFDELSVSGVRFSNAYAPIAVTGPSHLSLLSGLGCVWSLYSTKACKVMTIEISK